jgi:hypothetical protein
MLGGASELDLLVRVLGDTKDLDKELAGAGKSVGGFTDGIAGMATKLLPAAAAAGAAAAALGAMASAASEDATEQRKLESAIAAATGSNDDYTDSINAAIDAGAAKAYSDSEVRDALQSLVTATGDVAAANELLGPAMDIARLAGVDLAVAADAIAKAEAGQDAQLAKLLPGMEKGATAADTLASATALAAGQADIYADSAAGMGDQAKNAFGEISESIGAALLPVLEALLPLILAVLDVFTVLLGAILPPLTKLIGLLVPPLKAVADVVSKLAGWLQTLVTWLGKAADAAGAFLDKINPLSNIKLPSLPFGNAAGAAMPRAVELAGGYGRDAGAASYGVAYGGAGGIVINVQTTGDSLEAAQVFARTLRKVQRLNAGLVLPSAGRTF